MRKTHLIIKLTNSMLIDLPTPSNISYMWNFGSLLGVMLAIQLISGVMLTMHFSPAITLSFETVVHISQNVNYGWFIRSLHANGASFFFLLVYLHIGRGIYYGGYRNIMVWNIGIFIFMVMMITAFLGYVLPWGQMSFWAATVITNLLSAIPLFGEMLVQWIWGGFSVSNPTLTRFFALHFILPFVLVILVVLHLTFLHNEGSNNPLGTPSNLDKSPFHPYFSSKDMLGLMIITLILAPFSLYLPFILSDAENFIPANPLVTPIHIQPEWYFLFAYAILRSIPNKMGGVVALFSSLLILFILPITLHHKFQSINFYSLGKILFWSFMSLFMLLTWMGAQPVEPPFSVLSIHLTLMYFLFFPIFMMSFKFSDQMI
uniref:Cytochrome b n=1 Tax=Songthela hangzhouensis TaxID=1649374 RepID=Q6JT34_9ARAC|nr:cytochrome b [Songthela hangzhouensis]AAP51144.1 cytochrome b [Songthela hangzhouensis]